MAAERAENSRIPTCPLMSASVATDETVFSQGDP